MNEAEAIVNVIFVNNVDAVATIAGIRAVKCQLGAVGVW